MPFLSRKQSCKGQKAAVLIGINYSSTENALQGCESDVNRIKTYLQVQCGFEDVTVMTEKSAIQPTKANIIAQLNRVAQRTHLGVDHVVIHYSGHGTSVRDTDRDEADRKDEAWFAMDQQLLLDDEIRTILNKFSPWCEVLVLVDACHSGSGIDLPLKYVGSADFVDLESSTAPLCDAIMISGCTDTQTSDDAFLSELDGFGGAMTDSFLACLPKSRTIFELIDNMHTYMRAHRHSQRPQLSSSRPLEGTEHLTRWLR